MQFKSLTQSHSFHMVTPSPWPILLSMCLLMQTLNFILLFHFNFYLFVIPSMIIMIILSFMWWRDIIRESSFQGSHLMKPQLNMSLGMWLFIISEVLFFMSMFWSFLHSALSPTLEIGVSWPPNSIIIFNPLSIPLINTIILISSSLTMTNAHLLVYKKNSSNLNMMSLTIILGLLFSMLQYIEYINAPFSMNDSIYGNIFFMLTGFHGIHVILGTIFIIISLKRSYKNHFSKNHHFGLKSSGWYWHFVDLVWLLVFSLIYCWTFYF